MEFLDSSTNEYMQCFDNVTVRNSKCLSNEVCYVRLTIVQTLQDTSPLLKDTKVDQVITILEI